MIQRYSTPETDALFSEVGKMTRWLETRPSNVLLFAPAPVLQFQ
jgi:hypothetical protein